MRILLAIFGLSLFLRLLFVGTELRGHSQAQIITFNWDSREYVHLGHNLASTGHYLDDTNPDAEARRQSHFFGLLRTPGYPLFLAVFERLTGSITAALWAQAVLGSLLPVLVLLIGQELLGDTHAAAAAAVISAFSSTGIGVCGIFLVDQLFSLCVIAAWWMLLGAVRLNRFHWYLCSGLVLGLGVLVKPATLYWPLVLPAVAWLLGRAFDRPVAWRSVAVTCLLPLLAVGAWCWRNQRVEGGWVYCIVDAQNLRHFVAPLTEERAKAGKEPSFDAIMQNQNAARARDWNDMIGGQLTSVELGNRQRAQTLQIIRNHPWVAIQCLWSCAWDNWAAGWPYTRDQLSNAPNLKGLVIGIDYLWCVLGRSLGIPLILLGLLEPVVAGAGLRDPQHRRRFFGTLALLLTFGYFFILCGTSFSIGFRTLYPAEFTLLLMMTGGVAAGIRLLGFRQMSDVRAD
jgi:4-amino-4-deoxy-L-arabinose transferase-like glycosyltransferase